MSPSVIDGYLKIGDVSGGNGSINIHTIYQQNGLRSLIISKNSDDSDMNGDLNNGDASCGNGFINSQILSHVRNPHPLMIQMGALKMVIQVVGIFSLK